MWKLNAAIWLLLAGAIAALLQFAGPRAIMIPAFVAVLAIGLFAWLALGSVKCPRCRRSLVAWAMRNSDALHWLDSLIGIRACPWCQLDGQEPDEDRPPARP